MKFENAKQPGKVQQATNTPAPKPVTNEPAIADREVIDAVEAAHRRKKQAKLKARNEVVTRRMAQKPVNKRFEMMETIVTMVIQKFSPSVIICGTGGLGKSHLVKERLKAAKLIEDKEGPKGYTWVAGHMAPTGLYTAMHRRKDGGVLVLDDVDIWSNETMMELCKAALDSYAERTISWDSSWADNKGLPRKFPFKGQVIFITNKEEKDMPQPLIDRSFFVPVVLTGTEVLERMQKVLPDMFPKVPLQMKQEVLAHLKTIASEEDPVTFRSLDRAIRTRLFAQHNIQKGVDWKELLDTFGV
tara:strand:+ start:5717 stop:6619 length:903 start_codon:yes stop_codon:yes gene_type:complete